MNGADTAPVVGLGLFQTCGVDRRDSDNNLAGIQKVEGVVHIDLKVRQRDMRESRWQQKVLEPEGTRRHVCAAKQLELTVRDRVDVGRLHNHRHHPQTRRHRAVTRRYGDFQPHPLLQTVFL